MLSTSKSYATQQNFPGCWKEKNRRKKNFEKCTSEHHNVEAIVKEK
jgi:hypothetical protein